MCKSFIKHGVVQAAFYLSNPPPNVVGFFTPVKQENDPHISKRFTVASVERRLSEGDKRGDINLLRFGGC